MLGFLIGFASLVGLIAVLKRGGGCGRGWRGHGHHDHSHHGGWHDEGWHARRHRRHRGRSGRRGWLRFLSAKLDTTPGQEKEIAAAIDDFVEKTRDLRREVDTSREDLAKLLRTETLDEEVLGGLYARHEERLRALHEAFGDALGRIHQALDPDQRERLAALIDRGYGPDFGGPYRGWA